MKWKTPHIELPRLEINATRAGSSKASATCTPAIRRAAAVLHCGTSLCSPGGGFRSEFERAGWEGAPGEPAATALPASVAVSANEQDWFVLNASPDLRARLRQRSPPPRGLRRTDFRVWSRGDVESLAGC